MWRGLRKVYNQLTCLDNFSFSYLPPNFHYDTWFAGYLYLFASRVFMSTGVFLMYTIRWKFLGFLYTSPFCSGKVRLFLIVTLSLLSGCRWSCCHGIRHCLRQMFSLSSAELFWLWYHQPILGATDDVSWQVWMMHLWKINKTSWQKLLISFKLTTFIVLMMPLL